MSRLLERQFPQWAHLLVSRVELDGWDNTTFRLGDEFSVRLPSADGYVPQVDKEHRWLPVLAPQLPVRIPEPVARGEPEAAFPRPWSVYRWLQGEPATVERVHDLELFAHDLSVFLAALYEIDPASGPPAGQHSFFRGGQRGRASTRASRASMSPHDAGGGTRTRTPPEGHPLLRRARLTRSATPARRSVGRCCRPRCRRGGASRPGSARAPGTGRR